MADSRASDARIESLFSITRGASFFAVGRVVYNVFAFLFHLLLTNSVGPAAYGVYSFAHTVAVAATVFTNLGSDKSILRYIPRYADDADGRDRVLTLSLLTSISGGLVLASGMFVAAPIIADRTLEEPLLVSALRAFALLLFFRTMTKIVSNSFRAADRPEYDVVLRNITQPGLRLLAVVVAIALALSPVNTFLAIVVAGGASTLIAFALLYRLTDYRPNVRFDSTELREYYTFSLPLTFKDLGSFLYTRIDVLMVGFFLSSAVVGVYNISVFVSTVVVLPLAAINKMFPSMASKLNEAGQYAELRSVYATTTRWSISLALPLALGGVVYAAEILSLFSPTFAQWNLVFTLFVCGQFFNAAVGPSGFLLMMTDHQFLITANQWGFGVLNIVLNYVFITQFGAIGAAAATSIVLASLNILRVIEVYWFEGMLPYSRTVVKPIAAGAIALPVMLAGHVVLSGILAMFLGGAAGVVVYLLALATLGIESEDVELFNRIRGDEAPAGPFD